MNQPENPTSQPANPATPASVSVQPATAPQNPPPAVSAPPAQPPATPPPSQTVSSDGLPPASSPFRFLIPILVVLLIVVGIAVLLFKVFNFNPFGGSTATPQAMEIEYWGLWEPSHIMADLFKEFEAAHPGVTVKYTQQKSDDYRERLQNALESGQGPDIFRYHQTWVTMFPHLLSTLPEEVMSQQEYTQSFYPVAQNWLKVNNGFVGIPLMIDGLGLYYNKSILEAAGRTVPTTWDELRRVAKLVTVSKDGQIQRGGVALGTTNNVEHWPDIVGLMMLQNSASPVKPNNQLGQDALTFYTIYAQSDKVWDESLPNSTYAFATEKAVMMIAPSWRAHDVKSINPDLNFAIAPAPTLPDTTVTWASFWVEGVSAKTNSAKQKMSWELLKFLSQKESLRKMYAAASGERLFGEPFSRVDMADQLKGDPYVGAYIAQAPQAKGWYLASFTHDNGLNDGIIKYYEDAINAIRQGATAAQALSTTETGISQVLSRYAAKK